MTWIKGEFVFHLHAAILTVSRHDQLCYIEVAKMLRGFAENPDGVAEAFRTWIIKRRPDLVGGQLYSMRYNQERRWFEFEFYHSSFAAVHMGDELARQPLLTPEVHHAIREGEPLISSQDQRQVAGRDDTRGAGEVGGQEQPQRDVGNGTDPVYQDGHIVVHG